MRIYPGTPNLRPALCHSRSYDPQRLCGTRPLPRSTAHTSLSGICCHPFFVPVSTPSITHLPPRPLSPLSQMDTEQHCRPLPSSNVHQTPLDLPSFERREKERIVLMEIRCVEGRGQSCLSRLIERAGKDLGFENSVTSWMGEACELRRRAKNTGEGRGLGGSICVLLAIGLMKLQDAQNENALLMEENVVEDDFRKSTDGEKIASGKCRGRPVVRVLNAGREPCA
ncbi:hypothetical protein V8E36_005675 [Tilletia maclaganii]